MEQIPVPPHVVKARPWATTHTIAPPPGRDDIYCAEVQLQRLPDEDTTYYLHWKPTIAEVEALAMGGTVELAVLAEQLVPVSLSIWAPPAKEN